MRDYHVFTDTGHGSDVDQLQAPGSSDMLWTFAEFVNLQREMHRRADGVREPLQRNEDGIAYLRTASGMIRVWCKIADTDNSNTPGISVPEKRKPRKARKTFERKSAAVVTEHQEDRVVEPDPRPRKEYRGWWNR